MQQDKVDWVRVMAIAKHLARIYLVNCDFNQRDSARRELAEREEDLESLAVDHLHKKLDKFKPGPGSNFHGWSYRVMQNAMRDELRRHNRERKRLTFTDDPKKFNPKRACQPTADMRSEARNWLASNKIQLTPTERKIVEIYFQEGDLSDKEVAETLGIQSVASVRVHRCHLLSKCKSLK